MENEEFIISTNINLDNLWQNTLDEISKGISALSFDVWIQSLELEDLKDDVLILSTPTKSSKNFLLKKGLAVIANTETLGENASQKASIQHKLDLEKQAAVELCEKVSKAYVRVTLRCGENGKVFGGVSSKEI